MINIIQPERPCNPIRIPACKKTRRDPDQVIEDRHAHHKHEGRSVHQEDEKNPAAPAQQSMRMEMSTFTEEAYKEQFRCSVAVQTACNQEIRDRDAVRRFRPLRR